VAVAGEAGKIVRSRWYNGNVLNRDVSSRTTAEATLGYSRSCAKSRIRRCKWVRKCFLFPRALCSATKVEQNQRNNGKNIHPPPPPSSLSPLQLPLLDQYPAALACRFLRLKYALKSLRINSLRGYLMIACRFHSASFIHPFQNSALKCHLFQYLPVKQRSCPNIPHFYTQDIELPPLVTQRLVPKRGTAFADPMIEAVVEPQAVMSVSASNTEEVCFAKDHEVVDAAVGESFEADEIWRACP